MAGEIGLEAGDNGDVVLFQGDQLPVHTADLAGEGAGYTGH